MSLTGFRQFRLSIQDDSKWTIAPPFILMVALTRSRVGKPLLLNRPSTAMANTSRGRSLSIQKARSAIWDIRNHSGPVCSAQVMFCSTHEIVSERTKVPHTRLADLARGNGVACGDERRIPAVVVVHHELPAGTISGGKDFLAFPDRLAHGLFQEHVLARIQGFDRIPRMGMIRGCDGKNLYPVVGEHLVEGGRPIASVLLADEFRPRLASTAHANQINSWVLAVSPGVNLAVNPNPNHTNPNSIHLRLSLLVSPMSEVSRRNHSDFGQTFARTPRNRSTLLTVRP